MRQLSIKVRTRTPKEALNLGFMVARRYGFSLLLAVLPLWGVAVLLALAAWFGSGEPLWAMVVVWWLKPLYERPALMRLSRLVFHEDTDFWREQRSAFARGMVAELTVLRLARLMAPVRHALLLLEDVRGREYRERLRFFHGTGAGNSLLFLLALLEMAWVMAFLQLLPSFDIDVRLYFTDYAAFHESAYWLYASIALIYLPLCAVTTVLYVSCGFMFYLNRRIISEGWALALDLQALAARLPALLLSVGLAFAVFHVLPALAGHAQQDKAWVEARVNDEKSGPYAWREVPFQESLGDGSPVAWQPPGSGFGEVSRVLLIGGAIVFAAWLLIMVAQHGHRRGHRQEKSSHDAARMQVYHDGVAPPRDAALEQWQAGNMIAALAALYVRLVAEPERHQLPAFIRGESESEYLQRAQTQVSSGQQQFLRDFFALWQRGVYGHEVLAREAVRAVIERYLTLWQGV